METGGNRTEPYLTVSVALPSSTPFLSSLHSSPRSGPERSERRERETGTIRGGKEPGEYMMNESDERSREKSGDKDGSNPWHVRAV